MAARPDMVMFSFNLRLPSDPIHGSCLAGELHELVASMAIRIRNGCQALHEFRQRLYAIIHRASLIVGQANLLLHTVEVEFSLLQQRRRRLLRQVEAALRSGHTMGTLLEEVVSAAQFRRN